MGVVGEVESKSMCFSLIDGLDIWSGRVRRVCGILEIDFGNVCFFLLDDILLFRSSFYIFVNVCLVFK